MGSDGTVSATGSLESFRSVSLRKVFRDLRANNRSTTDFRAQIIANDLLILPVVFAYVSALWQTVAGISQAVRIAARRANNPTPDPNIGLVEGLRVHVRSYGGYVVYGFMMARLVGSLSLLYLSLAAPQQHCQHTPVYNFCVQPTAMTFVSIR